MNSIFAELCTLALLGFMVVTVNLISFDRFIRGL